MGYFSYQLLSLDVIPIYHSRLHCPNSYCFFQVCKPAEQSTAASLMVALLGLGLGTGALLSNFVVQAL